MTENTVQLVSLERLQLQQMIMGFRTTQLLHVAAPGGAIGHVSRAVDVDDAPAGAGDEDSPAGRPLDDASVVYSIP